MVQITERDDKLIQKILTFKMIPYNIAKEIYNNNWAYYKRIKKLIKEKILKRVGKRYLTLDIAGIDYVNFEYWEKYVPLDKPTSKETIHRWKNVILVGNRHYIYPFFKTCWQLKLESKQNGKEEGISNKNKVLGVANGYGIFKISHKTNTKVLTEVISDMNELVNYGIDKFIFLCEGQEKLKDFLNVITKYMTFIKAKALHALPLNDSGLKIMDVIVGIGDYKQMVANAVYQNSVPSSYKIFDFETQDKAIYVGIDGEVISKLLIETTLKIGINKPAEILILKGQEWRFENINANLRAITLQEFLNIVNY